MRYVSYYRVSTAKQGRSGLGLDAQREAVRSFVGDAPLMGEFTEVESGKVNERPQLHAALACCRVHGAVLVIAKLDRLARNAVFLLSLRDAGIEFIAADMPSANRLTVGIMALVAEQEREVISQRTKAALAAAMARGTKLGNPDNLSNRMAGTEKANALKAEKARARARDLAGTIAAIQAGGITSLNGIAGALNAKGIPTNRGSQWTATAVKRLLQLGGSTGRERAG